MVSAYVEPSPSETRSAAQLRHIQESWRRSGRVGAKAFIDGLDNWIALSTSDHTRRSYTFSVFEFFDWYELTMGGLLPLPDRIERRTAQAYVDYLRTRGEGLDEARLAKDPRMVLELAAYRAIKRRPGIDEPALRLALEAEHSREVARRDRELPGWFARFTACLVTRRIADRRPTYLELRTVYKGREAPPYRYELHVHSRARGVERSSTILSRTEALASLWSWWIDHSGENTGQKPALEHNIWEPIAEQFVSAATAQKSATRERTSMTFETFKRLVAATFSGDRNAFENVRDRAIFLFMLYTAVRSDELVELTRSSITGDLVTVIGKGKKMRQFRLPEPIRPHLAALTAVLERTRDDDRVAADRRERAAMLLGDGAPLFPAAARRGCAMRASEALGGSGLRMMFRRRAREAGLIDPDVFRTVHPHAIRGLAAKMAVEAGTPITHVQAIMGHEHVSTTGAYAAEHDPRALALFQPPPAPPPAPPAVYQPPGPVIEAELVEPPRAALGAPAPAPPPERRLVEIGGARISHEAALGKDLEPEDVIRRLDDLYRPANWGERDMKRVQLHTKKVAFGGFDADEDRLTYAFLGDISHLVWWDGFSGKLRPSLPVMSVRQAFEGTARFGKPIREGLTDLWLRWYESPEKGPTASAALVQWVREALETMDQVELARDENRAQWVLYDSPLRPESDTFREHREDMILGWFEARASVWTMSAGRSGGKSERSGHTQDVVHVPDFYKEEDPLAAIPEAERSDFFDWLAAMTGKSPMSADKRFLSAPTDTSPSLSRRDLAGLIGLFCAFEQSEEELGDDPGEARRALKLTSDAIERQVDKLSKGRSRLNYAKKVADRQKETRAKQAGAKVEREGRRRFMLRILGELFGEAAQNDQVLALLTACGEEPLAGKSLGPGSYADFFQVKDGTIKHREGFQKAFAMDTGAHSECVARRIARTLYELKKRDKRVVAADRSAELETHLATWSAFKVPCPAALEAELRSRLDAPSTGKLDVAFERARAGEGRQAYDEAVREELEERAELGGRSVFETKGLAEGGGFHFAKNARRLANACPDGIVLLFWVHAHRRAARLVRSSRRR